MTQNNSSFSPILCAQSCALSTDNLISKARNTFCLEESDSTKILAVTTIYNSYYLLAKLNELKLLTMNACISTQNVLKTIKVEDNYLQDKVTNLEAISEYKVQTTLNDMLTRHKLYISDHAKTIAKYF
ncbi:hypothetical protein BB561_006779 [Smittium simulii]|uniref:Uncharacterized protein n=1 Tax=Smittium simulii TaxID=133385 RepID=A0A2T9Y1P0_9FUNG|nr:hypothetical protein BB561_006779 [Smittium simulii]